ncbi:AMP-binding protein [Mesorhizobium sp. 1B3]|uniref:AMP-binding protein n=1 Tax=Mesorhizobium sp. 1B3 TaxID=3243599 RepID=UPI003D991ED1
MSHATHMRSFGIWSAISRNALVHRDRLAFTDGELTETHGDFRARCEALAAKLAAGGVQPGERIAVLSENSLGVHALLGAAARLGAILAPLNWRLSEAELSAVIADCQPSAIFADDATLPLASSFANVADVKLRATFGAAAGDFVAVDALKPGDVGSLPEPAGGDAPLLMIYTAATDGVARAAIITGANLVASAVQLVDAIGTTEADRFLGNLPMFHIMAQSFAFAAQFAGGATIVRPRFDAVDAAATIARHKVTLLGSFPPMLAGILDAAQASGADISSLRAAIGLEGPPVIERLEREWPGARFWTGFGQTETSGMATITRASDNPGAAGTAGSLTEIAVVDGADRPVATGRVGEIVVRGPAVMAGYWRRDEENAVVFRNGWHHTGDLGKLDDQGRLYYAGRSPAKELIKTGGENVYPAEVEKTLLEHCAVAEAVVFGVPDGKWGERVVAVAVLHDGDSADETELREFIGSRIAAYKRPRSIVFADKLPRNANGLIDRAATRETFAGQLA